MKAAILYGPRDVRLEEMEPPEIGPDEILVRVKAALTCGTDAKVYLRGGHPKMIKPPAVFGHEFSGLVEEVGKNVKGFQKGMRVVAANSAPCNRCFYCRIGRHSLCENLLFINGAYAELTKIPSPIVEQNLLPIPDGLSFREAALVEPLACVIHGIEESAIGLGDTVAINGTGPIGLLFLQVAKLKGARTIVSEREPGRLQLARECGADELVDVSQTGDQVEAVRKLTEGRRGVDVAIEATGIPEVWEKTVRMARKGGLVNLFGGCPPGTEIHIDTSLIHYSELTIKGVFHHTPACIRMALELISRGRINTLLLITGELPLEKVSEALEAMVARQGMKTAVIP